MSKGGALLSRDHCVTVGGAVAGVAGSHSPCQYGERSQANDRKRGERDAALRFGSQGGAAELRNAPLLPKAAVTSLSKYKARVSH